MKDLANKTCEACQAGAPKVDLDSAEQLLIQIPGWDIVEEGGICRLKRIFTFSNFETALAFTVKVGAMAESENHHPALLTEWGRVTVTWWTHKIKGLHLNDFIMAAKTNSLH